MVTGARLPQKHKKNASHIRYGGDIYLGEIMNPLGLVLILGLIGIKERAALVGGDACIISSPNEGTTIRVVLPLRLRGGDASRASEQ